MLMTSHFPCPQMPGTKHADVLAEVTGVIVLGAGAGDFAAQSRFKEQFGTLQGSDGISEKPTSCP